MIGERIKEARKKRKMSQEELAEKIHKSRSMISCYENGHALPTLCGLVELADVLGVTTDYLLGRTEVLKND